MEDILTETRTAIEKNKIDLARDLLRPLLQNEPSAEVYYLASSVAISQQQKITFLEKANELDPFHEKARNALKTLNELENDRQGATQSAKVFNSRSEPVQVAASSTEENAKEAGGSSSPKLKEEHGDLQATIFYGTILSGIAFFIFKMLNNVEIEWLKIFIPFAGSFYVGAKAKTFRWAAMYGALITIFIFIVGTLIQGGSDGIFRWFLIFTFFWGPIGAFVALTAFGIKGKIKT